MTSTSTSAACRPRDLLRRFWWVAMLAVPATAPAAPPLGTQIGAIIPESWPDPGRGADIRNGMLLALKTWPGKPPALIVKDSACKPQQAATAAQSLVEAGVDVVLGGFCIVGTVPRVLLAAGVPFVSANSERFATTADTIVQFAAVPTSLSDNIAARLRLETGLRVVANSSCWIDYNLKIPSGADAVLCPTLHVQAARWDDVAPTYLAAYGRPFSADAARGYAAMQVALAAIRQLRAGARPANALSSAKDIDTLLGKVRVRDDRPAPDDAIMLSLSGQLPRLSAKEQGALDAVMKVKGCGCSQAGNCASDKLWSAMPFTAQCLGSNTQAQLVLRR